MNNDYDSNGWYIDCFCVGNDPCESEPFYGCNEEFSFSFEDINYRESELGKIYSFICPSCFRETVIDERDIPDDIKELIKDNNGYESNVVRKYIK